MPIVLDANKVCEFVAHWMGGTGFDELGELLGYTPRRLNDLLKDGFDRQGPATVRYSRSAKRWLSVARTEDLHGPCTALDAVTTLQAMRLWRRGMTPEALFPVVDTRTFRHAPAPDTFRILLGACVRKQVVDVTYRARTREHAVSFSPHTLIVAPHREHFRGYSSFELEGRAEFWDLVPSRVLSAEVRPKFGYVDAGHDVEWHTEEMLHLRLKAEMPDAMRQAVRYEHGISTDDLEVGPVRKALLPYVRGDFLNRRYEGFDGPAWDAS